MKSNWFEISNEVALSLEDQRQRELREVSQLFNAVSGRLACLDTRVVEIDVTSIERRVLANNIPTESLFAGWFGR